VVSIYITANFAPCQKDTINICSAAVDNKPGYYF